MAVLNIVERLKGLTVADVMNRKVVTVGANDPMPVVAKTFLDEGISAAPVTDVAGRFVGMISATDFLRRDQRTKVGGPFDARPATRLKLNPCDPDSVCSYMSGSVQTVRLDTPLIQAAKVMSAAHLHRLPVLDDQHRLVGMISTMDLTAAMVNLVDEWESSRYLGGRIRFVDSG